MSDKPLFCSPATQPERISGKEYSIRADVWSTGITLLELVQNRYPFPEDLTSIELLVYITHGEVRTYGHPHLLFVNIPLLSRHSSLMKLM